MEPPALILSSSSPLTPSLHTSPLLSTSISNDASPVSSASDRSSPPPSFAFDVTIDSADEQQGPRNSSESTIFSIYSMYSERRKTWRKSGLQDPSPDLARELEQHEHQKDKERAPGTWENNMNGVGSDEGTDSFYRASMSRQSSAGSRFFADSTESSPQLEPASHSNLRTRLHLSTISTASKRQSSESPWASADPDIEHGSESFNKLSNSHSAPIFGENLGLSPDARDSKLEPSTSTFIDLVESDRFGGRVSMSLANKDITSQPKDGFAMRSHVPHSGKLHESGISRSQSNLSDYASNAFTEAEAQSKPSRPPRAAKPPSPPSNSPPRSTPHELERERTTSHTVNDSISTNSAHFGTAFSHLHSACSSQEGIGSAEGDGRGYTTAPQSSCTDMGAMSSSSRQRQPQRFRVMNPTPPSPSPPPAPSSPPMRASKSISMSTSRPSMTSQKELPTPPPAEDQPRFSTSPSVKTIPKAEDEEPESYFVRNTYAQLDVTGVKGDGYEDGIERTRAKLGHDRRSVQLAAMTDARDKTVGEIAEKELKLLGDVDRYGFFTAPSHDRMILLPASAFAKALQPNTRTSNTSPPTPPTLDSTPKPPPVAKGVELRRMSKWSEMLESEARDPGGNVSVWRINPSKEKKLRSRVFKGIPDAWRAAAWEVLIGRFVASQKGRESLEAKELERMLRDLRTEYRTSVEKPSSYDVQIDLDVPRTINGHVLFKTRYGQGQRSLFHTLHSFSLRCKECGYCQGMGPLAATLLSYYEPEKVYANLVHFHDEYKMHDIFLPGFPGLLEAIYVQEKIIEKMLPGVYASFKKNSISTTSYATKWYITLFANSVPFQTQLRLWDAFFLEGRDVFVLTAVAIVWAFREHLASAQANFETALSLLSSFFVVEDEDRLMRWLEGALGDRRLRGDMERWRAEWKSLRAEGKDGAALL